MWEWRGNGGLYGSFHAIGRIRFVAKQKILQGGMSAAQVFERAAQVWHHKCQTKTR